MFSKKYIVQIMICFCSLFLIFFSELSFCYVTDSTHPNLSELVVNYYNILHPTRKLDVEELSYIKYGSIHEDGGTLIAFDSYTLGSRYFHHFYDPTKSSKRGFLEIYMDSLTWALSAQNLPEYDGNYSWLKAINTKRDKKESYTALGHIIHLLHDLTVPAHTRNDPHPIGDIYEVWVDDNWNDIWEEVWNEIISNTNTESPKYNDLGSLFHELASYTNKNFISYDTVDSYLDPINTTTLKIIDGTKYRVRTDENGIEYKVCAYSFTISYLNNLAIPPYITPYNPYILDDEVNKDYFKRLAKKAIVYGVSLINLYNDEGDKFFISGRVAEYVSGVVDSSQLPVLSGVSVSLVSEFGQFSTSTTTDANGKYNFSDLRNDTYKLTAYKTGYQIEPSWTVVINNNDEENKDFLAKFMIITPPILVSASPANSATDVPIGLTAISFTFNEPMGPGYSVVWNSTFDFTTYHSTPTWSSDQRTITFPLTKPLPLNTTIGWTLNDPSYGRSFADLDGNPLSITQGSFRTGQGTSVSTYDIREYWPLRIGDYSIAQDGSRAEGVRTETLDGVTLTVVRRIRSDGSISEDLYAFDPAEGKFKEYGYYAGVPMVLYKSDPPVVVGTINMRIGEIFTNTYRKINTSTGAISQSYTINGTFAGIETVTTPAGTFPDCLKFTFQGDDPPFTAWLAKGIGGVKEIRDGKENPVVYIYSNGVSYGTPPLTYDVRDYFPLRVGDYSIRQDGFTEIFDRTETLDGVTVKVVRLIQSNGTIFEELWAFDPVDGKLKQYGIREGVPLVLYKLDPPVVAGTNSMKIGDTFPNTYKKINTITGAISQSYTFNGTFAAIETLITPAGTFPDCLKYTVQREDGTSTNWLAKGIGMVKETEKNGKENPVVYIYSNGIEYGTKP